MRPPHFDCAHKFVQKGIVDGALGPRLPDSRVGGIITEPRVIGADVEADGEGAVGVDGGRGRIEENLSLNGSISYGLVTH